MTPRWPAPAYRGYLTLGASSAFFFSTYSTLSAIYRIQEAGLDHLVLVGTAFELSTFLFEVPTGVVADTISRRRFGDHPDHARRRALCVGSPAIG